MPLGGRESHVTLGGADARFAPRSTVNASVSTTGCSAEGCNPSFGRAEPRQEFIHPERLRDVVVGTGVEGEHLVALLVAGRQHESGISLQARIPRITSMPSMPGKPRSMIARSGRSFAAVASAVSPSGAVNTS